MKQRIRRASISTIIILSLSLSLWIQATAYFRLNIADALVRGRHYDAAIPFYKKALRKSRLLEEKGGLFRALNSMYRINGKSRTGLIGSRLTKLYLKSAQGHYRKMFPRGGTDSIDLKSLNTAADEYKNIAGLYKDYGNVFCVSNKDAEDSWRKALADARSAKIKLCFSFGRQYVEKKMWPEARDFYTKEILKYLKPITVIKRLQALYGKDEYVKGKIWKGEIFVVLEGFENAREPLFKRSIARKRHALEEHMISEVVSYEGRRSEHLRVSYKGHNRNSYDYWILPTDIYLDRESPPIGLRVFIKSEKPFSGSVGIGIRFPRDDSNAVLLPAYVEDRKAEWAVVEIEDIYMRIRKWAGSRGWNGEEVYIDKIALDTKYIDTDIYIDNIIIYLMPGPGLTDDTAAYDKKDYLKAANEYCARGAAYLKGDAISIETLDKAASEYKKAGRLYEYYKMHYATVAPEDRDKWRGIFERERKTVAAFCIAIGEKMIQNKRWKDAAAFYTRDISRYIDPVSAIFMLNEVYGRQEYSDIKKRIWPGGIYVVLQDFEDGSSRRFKHWTGNLTPVINEHRVINGIAHGGAYSEFFDLSYKGADGRSYDYWSMYADIAMKNNAPPLGLRAFIKGRGPFGGRLKLNIFYPQDNASAVIFSSQAGSPNESGWAQLKIEGLFEKAKRWAGLRGLHMKIAKINRVVIDTSGITNGFYIDDIELYILSSKNKEIF